MKSSLLGDIVFKISVASFLMAPSAGLNQETPTGKTQPGLDTITQRDGQHDFDFLAGSWKMHLKRLVRPLSGSHEWIELDGTTVCRTLLDGRAEIEEMKVESADKRMKIQGLAMRLYNPVSHQWSIWWVNANDGAMYPPPVYGEFKDGRGEFYDQDIFHGQAVFTRFVWTGTTTSSPHFEQSMSVDGGKTWELWWITDQTKDEAKSSNDR